MSKLRPGCRAVAAMKTTVYILCVVVFINPSFVAVETNLAAAEFTLASFADRLFLSFNKLKRDFMFFHLTRWFDSVFRVERMRDPRRINTAPLCRFHCFASNSLLLNWKIKDSHWNQRNRGVGSAYLQFVALF